MYYGQFNDAFPPQIDGVAHVTLQYARCLHQMEGVSACAVAPYQSGATDCYDFPVLRYSSLPLPMTKEYVLGLPWAAFHTRNALQRLPLDLVHCHCPFSSGTLAKETARSKGIPLIATFHSKYAEDFTQRLKTKLAGDVAARHVAAFYRQADEVWAVNASSARTLAAYGYQGPVKVMPNGCDFEPLWHTPAMRAQVLQRYHLQDKPLLLYVGRMVEQKNISLLLQAFARMHTDCNLLLIGDGAYRSQYQRLAHELGVAASVHFAGKVQDRDWLRCIYASADLLCLPSTYDNAPLVVREAAACGTPAALIRGSDAAEGVEDGTNGYLSALDATAYAHRLDQSLADPGALLEAGERARQTIYMSWEKIVITAESRYREVIAEFKEKQTRSVRRSIPSLTATY